MPMHRICLQRVKNKLCTLYNGTKKDNVIGRIASTFVALSEYADFSQPAASITPEVTDESGSPKNKEEDKTAVTKAIEQKTEARPARAQYNLLNSLQYHINIVLPESRDQAVYDAIFRSLRDHLG